MTVSFVAQNTAMRKPPAGTVLVKDEVKGWRVESINRPKGDKRKISVAYVELLDLKPILAEPERRNRD